MAYRRVYKCSPKAIHHLPLSAGVARNLRHSSDNRKKRQIQIRQVLLILQQRRAGGESQQFSNITDFMRHPVRRNIQVYFHCIRKKENTIKYILSTSTFQPTENKRKKGLKNL